MDYFCPPANGPSFERVFSLETIKFTIAHELGHALLHPNMVLHRDRPMDGSKSLQSKDYKELQANKFAAYFLNFTILN